MFLGTILRLIIFIIVVWALFTMVPGDIPAKIWHWLKTIWQGYILPIISFFKNILVNSWSELKNVWPKIQNFIPGPKQTEENGERKTLKTIIQERRMKIQQETQEK